MRIKIIINGITHREACTKGRGKEAWDAYRLKAPGFFDRLELLVNEAGFLFDVDEGDGNCIYRVEFFEYDIDDQDEEGMADPIIDPVTDYEEMCAARELIQTHPMADVKNFWQYA